MEKTKSKNVSYYVSLLNKYTTSNGKEFSKLSGMLQSLAKMIEEQSTDNELLKARAEKEAANAAYTKELNRILLNDEKYTKTEEYITAKAVAALGQHEYRFFTSTKTNFAVNYPLCSLQKIASWLKGVDQSYINSMLEAKENIKKRTSKEQKKAALLAQLAALDLED